MHFLKKKKKDNVNSCQLQLLENEILLCIHEEATET